MRLIKSQTTNSRSILGNGLKHDTRTKITTLDGTVMLTPYGTSAERPATGVDGYFRFNLDFGQLEYFWDGEWRFVGSGSDGFLITQVFYSGYNSFSRLYGPLDHNYEEYTISTATDKTLVFVEQLHQTPHDDYIIVQNPLDTDIGGEVRANQLEKGKTYYIIDPGTTDFTVLGSTDNLVQTEFVADYTLTINPTLPIPNPNSAVTGDEFGYAIDVSDSYIIVGAPLEDDVPNSEVQAGAVYIYTYTGTMISKITNPRSFGSATLDWFGYSVAINSTYAAVGSYKEDDAVATGSQSGKAYLYLLSPLTGVPYLTFDNPDNVGDYEDHFGYALAMNETHIVITAPKADDTGPATPAGKAYIYDLNNLADPPIILTNPVSYADGGRDFGSTVTMNDSHIFITAPQQNAVYMYDLDGELIAPIPNPTNNANDLFGISLDCSYQYLIVGAPDYNSPTASSSGIAYLYDIKGPNPTIPKYTFANPNILAPEEDDNFGYKVAVSDNFIVVSAQREDDISAVDVGRVYIFDPVDGTLAETQLNPNANATADNDNYGTAIAATDTHMVVGAHKEDNATTTSSGAIYVNEIVGKGTGTGLAREVGYYVQFTEPLNTAPVLKRRNSDGQVSIEFDFDANNFQITVLYNVEKLLGTLATADRWTTPRQLELTGAVSGTVMMDGSNNVTMDTTLEDQCCIIMAIALG